MVRAFPLKPSLSRLLEMGDCIVNEPRGLHMAWVILGICFINLFISYSVRLGYSVILPEMIRHLGFSRPTAALFSTPTF